MLKMINKWILNNLTRFKLNWTVFVENVELIILKKNKDIADSVVKKDDYFICLNNNFL
jgi:hypothetical protein